MWKKNDEGVFASKIKSEFVKKRKGDYALKTVAPNYHTRRQTDNARQVNTIAYRADYFDHIMWIKRETGNVRCSSRFGNWWALSLHYVRGNNGQEKQ